MLKKPEGAPLQRIVYKISSFKAWLYCHRVNMLTPLVTQKYLESLKIKEIGRKIRKKV